MENKKTRGRGKLPYGKKKKSIRIWFENDTIDNLGAEKIKSECARLIKDLQSASLTKCAQEALRK